MKQRHLYINGLVLVSATMISNVINFVFNIYLGRTLTLSDFGELSLFTSLLYLTSVPLGSFSATTAHSIAVLYGKYSKKHAQAYYRYMFNRTVVYGVVVTILWALAIPFLTKFFKTTPVLMAFFAPLWAISVASANFSGYLKGTLSFGKMAALAVTESAVRLAAVFVLVRLGLHGYITGALVISYIVTLLLGWYFSSDSDGTKLKKADLKFNTMFFFASAMTGITVITFLTLDVILVKHFLSAVEAGEYGLLSLVGKMTYFLGSLFGPFMIPIVAHNEGAKKDSRKTFFFLLGITLFFSGASYLGLGVWGWFFVPIIFGAKSATIVHLLPMYVLSMALLTVSQPVVSYFQAKQNYSFAIVGFLVSILQIVLTVLYHANLQQIVWVMLATSIANLIFMGILYFVGDKLKVIYSRAFASRRKLSYEA